MNKKSKEINELEDKFKGWEFAKTAKGHVVATHPLVPKKIYGSGTPSDHRAIMNFESELKKASKEYIKELMPSTGIKHNKIKKIEQFESRQVPDSKNIIAFRDVAKCSKCGGEESLRRRATSRMMAPSHLAHRFRSMGWKIGYNRINDECPTCSNNIPTDRNTSFPPPVEKQLSNLFRVVDLKTRRKIMRQLDRVYIDDIMGYTFGENDTTVAARLQIEPDQVSVIREHLFGPDVVGSTAVKMRRETEKVKQDVKLFTKAILDHAAALETKLTSLSSRLAVLIEAEKDEPLT